jgi:hypothetical protein
MFACRPSSCICSASPQQERAVLLVAAGLCCLLRAILLLSKQILTKLVAVIIRNLPLHRDAAS